MRGRTRFQENRRLIKRAIKLALDHMRTGRAFVIVLMIFSDDNVISHIYGPRAMGSLRIYIDIHSRERERESGSHDPRLYIYSIYTALPFTQRVIMFAHNNAGDCMCILYV